MEWAFIRLRQVVGAYKYEELARTSFPLLFKSITICLFFGLIVATILNQISQAVFLRALMISCVYSLSCSIIVVFPIAMMVKKGWHSTKLLFVMVMFVLLTLISTLIAEFTLAVLIFEIPFSPLGQGHLFWVNLMLSATSASILTVKTSAKKEEVTVDAIKFKVVDGYKLLDPVEVRAIFARDRHLFVATSEREILIVGTLSKMLEDLPEGFLQVSRSYIVRGNSIVQVCKEGRGRISLLLDGMPEQRIKVGVTYTDKVKEYLKARD